MTVTWWTPGVAGLGHKRSAEKSRTVDSSVGGGGGSSGVMNAARLEGQAVCKTERLQAISTPLGPYDKNYSRKRIREHSLERADCELHVCRTALIWGPHISEPAWLFLSFSSSLPQTLHGLEHPLHDSSQHALVPAQPPNTPAVHIFRELCAAGPEQPECPEHACKDAPPDLTSYLDDSNHQSGVFKNARSVF